MMKKILAIVAELLVASVIALATLCTGGCANQPLEPWHKTRLVGKFDASMAGNEVSSFDEYVALEDRLFRELREAVYSDVGTGPEFVLVRYSADSAADPFSRDPDYNRSFELPVDKPKGAVLLLHGRTGTPWSGPVSRR